MIDDKNIAWIPQRAKPINIESEIKRQIKLFFKKDIFIQNRLLQVLHYSMDDAVILPPYGLWLAALQIMPNLIEFLNSIGISLTNFNWSEWPSLRKIQPENVHYWYGTIENYLKTQLEDGFDLPIVDSINRRGEIGIIDCLIGTLQSPSFNSAKHFLYKAFTNLSVAEIAGFDQSRKAIKYASSVAHALADWFSPDPSFGDQQFIFYNDGHNIRIRPFSAYNIYQFQEDPLPDGSLWIARGNILQSKSIFSNDALELLEDLIQSEAKEIEFQKFFEQHPEFLLSIGNYKSLHPQLVIHEDSGERLIPDFFLEKINSDFCDICDLKRSSTNLIRNQKNRIRFKDIVREGIAQLEYYRNWFEDKSNRDAFYSRYGLKAFRPRVVLIIGRRETYYDEVNRIKLDSSLPRHIKLMTYDDVLDKVQQWKQIIKNTIH